MLGGLDANAINFEFAMQWQDGDGDLEKILSKKLWMKGWFEERWDPRSQILLGTAGGDDVWL
jgi:hypothetical protein